MVFINVLQTQFCLLILIFGNSPVIFSTNLLNSIPGIGDEIFIVSTNDEHYVIQNNWRCTLRNKRNLPWNIQTCVYRLDAQSFNNIDIHDRVLESNRQSIIPSPSASLGVCRQIETYPTKTFCSRLYYRFCVIVYYGYFETLWWTVTNCEQNWESFVNWDISKRNSGEVRHFPELLCDIYQSISKLIIFWMIREVNSFREFYFSHYWGVREIYFHLFVMHILITRLCQETTWASECRCIANTIVSFACNSS